MDEITLDLQTAVKGLAVLTAIPVVGFALWTEYFESFIRDRLAENPKFDTASEMIKVRLASLTVMIAQFTLYLGSGEIRREYPGLGNLLFVGALLIQLIVQSRTERNLRPAGDPAASEISLALRAFTWSTLGGALYIGILLAALRGSFYLAQIIHANAVWTVTLLTLGAISGILGGLGLGFAMGPIQMRKMFPTSPVQEPTLVKDLESCFHSAGLQAPAFYILELNQFQVGNAMMTGFQSGKAWFRPALYISRTLLAGLSPEEFRAVILHEVSHLKARHMRRRFLLSAGMILCASLGTGFLILLAQLLIPQFSGSSIFGLIAVLASFWATFKMLEKQNRLQEIEADLSAVQLGASIEDLAGALRKIDLMNGVSSQHPSMAAQLSGSGHPATEERIKYLQNYIKQNSTAPLNSPIPSTTPTTVDSEKRAA